MRKIISYIAEREVKITRFELIAIHTLIFHAVGGFTILKGWIG